MATYSNPRKSFDIFLGNEIRNPENVKGKGDGEIIIKDDIVVG
ncbi:MAG: hypothetical protein R2825_11355 [Saprospiraceae bacterium]